MASDKFVSKIEIGTLVEKCFDIFNEQKKMTFSLGEGENTTINFEKSTSFIKYVCKYIAKTCCNGINQNLRSAFSVQYPSK